MSPPRPAFDPDTLLAHAGSVRALARSLVRHDVHLADDLAQEACLAALEKTPATGNPLGQWLGTVVRNLVRQKHRRDARRSAREELAARQEAQPSVLDHVEQLSVHRELVDAVSALEEPYRETIVLRYFEELTPSQIASRTSVPVATVKARLARGLDKLRTRLDREHGGDARALLLASIPLSRRAGDSTAASTGALLVNTNLKIAIGVAVVACALWWWTRDAGSVAIPESAGVPAAFVQDSETLVGSPSTTEREAAALTGATPVVEALPPLSLRDPHIIVEVVDKADRPIEGALVETFWDTEPAKLTTDAGGRCELPFPATRMTLCRVRVVASGYRHLESTFWRTPVWRVRLGSLTALRGRVLDADTKAPVMGAVIELAEPCTCTPPERTTSAGDGTFTLTAAPEGELMSLHVEAEGYPRDAFTFTRQDASREEEFLIGRGIEIEGTVVDFTTGAPVAGARITSTDRGGATLVTDAAGRFAGRALTSRGESTLRLRVEADGWCTLIGWRVALADLRSIRLPRTAFFEGTIVDAEGKPAAGVELTVQVDWDLLSRTRPADSTAEIPLDELGPTWSVESPATFREPGTLQPPPAAKSDERGHYRTKGVQPFASYLKISSPRRAEGWIEMKAPSAGSPGETVRLDLTLPRLPFGTVVGRVTVNGSPRQALVQWKGETRAGESFTHADGSYGLEYVEAGAVTLTVHPEGFAQPPTGSDPTGFEESVEIALAQGETKRHDFELDVPLGQISGHVRYESGRPAPGLWVTVRTPFGAISPRIHVRVQSDDEGRWSADVPERVELYSAQMSTPSNELIQDGLRVGASNVDFVMPENGRLLVRGVDAVTKVPVERLEILWRRPGQLGFAEMWMPRLPDGQGWYSLPLPTGDIELLVDGGDSGYLPRVMRDVHVRKTKADERLEIELERGLDLELRLAQGAAPWPTTHAVALIEASESVTCGQSEGTPTMQIQRKPGSSSWASRQVRLGGAGTAQLKGLVAGRYRLISCPPGLTFEPTEIEVSPSSPKSVEIRTR